MEKISENNDLCPGEKLCQLKEDVENIVDYPTVFLLPFLYDDEEEETGESRTESV